MNEGFRLGSGGRLGGPFDRLAAAERNRGFKLNDSVGNDAENNFDDVRKAKRALAQIGFFPAERARIPNGHVAMIADPDFQTGIRAFQRSNDLKVDGFIRPGGETEQAIGKAIGPEARPSSGKLRSDLGVADNDGPEPEDRLPKPAARGGTPTQTAERAEPSVTGRPRLKPTPPPPPPLPTLRDPFARRASELRGEDKKGKDEFGVSREGGTRRHEGIDVVGTPGEEVRAMATGKVLKIAAPYEDSKDPKDPKVPRYRTVEIETPSGYIVRQFYVSPQVNPGDKVTAGRTVIGELQDLTLHPDLRGITNHVHVEVRDPRSVAYAERQKRRPTSSSQFQEIDPTPLFESGQRVPHP